MIPLVRLILANARARRRAKREAARRGITAVIAAQRLTGTDAWVALAARAPELIEQKPAAGS